MNAPIPAYLPTVIALHSSAASGRQWRPLAVALAGRARVIAPDLHGHGDGPPVPLEPAAIVAADTAHVANLVMSIPDRVHLVAHSYGAAIALRVARRCGAKVRSLALVEPVAFRVLFDCYGNRLPAAAIIDIGRAIRMFMRAGRSGYAAQRFVSYWGGEEAWARLGPDARASVASRMPAVAAHFAALSSDDFTLDACRAIDAPVLLLAGLRTRAPALRISELLASALPNVRDERLPGGNHVEALESPSRIVERVVRFLGEVDVRMTGTLREVA